MTARKAQICTRDVYTAKIYRALANARPGPRVRVQPERAHTSHNAAMRRPSRSSPRRLLQLLVLLSGQGLWLWLQLWPPTLPR